jgi:putative transposase
VNICVYPWGAWVQVRPRIFNPGIHKPPLNQIIVLIPKKNLLNVSVKSYNFRIYPNRNQETALIFVLNTCRHLYNAALAKRKHQADINRIYQDFQVFPWGKLQWMNYYDQAADLIKNKNEYQKQVYSQILQNVLKRVERSFLNFFRGAGYPRFRGRNRYDSFTYPQKGFELIDGKIKLSKIGLIKIKQHREIEDKIKTCTIKRDVDHWYVSFSVEINQDISPVNVSSAVGVDVGLKSLITLSSGEQIEPPKHYRKAEDKLRAAGKSLSRKVKGSNNRNKQQIKVGRVHRKIRNQRKDFAHKVSRTLVDSYGKIAFEKLQIQNMVKNKHLAKSISDAGWYQLMEMTKFKAEWAGKVVSLVNAHNTTQLCSRCGEKVKKSLAVRVHNCPVCGLILERDHNAAINILNEVGQGMPELTPVEMFVGTSVKQDATDF